MTSYLRRLTGYSFCIRLGRPDRRVCRSYGPGAVRAGLPRSADARRLPGADREVLRIGRTGGEDRARPPVLPGDLPGLLILPGQVALVMPAPFTVKKIEQLVQTLGPPVGPTESVAS